MLRKELNQGNHSQLLGYFLELVALKNVEVVYS